MTTSFFPYFPGNSSMPYDQIKQSCPGIDYQWLVFFPKQAPGFSFERLNGKRLLPGLAVAWIGNYSPSQNRPGTASVVSRNWLVFRRKEFSFPARRERRAYPSAVCEERATKREAKRTATRRVAPKTAWGFVAPRSQSAAAMLLRRALPQTVLGATKHQTIARHHTSASAKSIALARSRRNKLPMPSTKS